MNMKNKIKKIKQTGSSKEILLRIIVMVLIIILVFYSGDKERQVVSIFGFLISFFISIYLHKHLFPFMTAAVFMFLVASMQEFWNVNYIDSIFTHTYWIAGNVLLIASLITFGWNLIFNYKIVENGNTNQRED